MLDSLVALATADSVTALGEAGVVAVGYAERLRLGLGSPFRLTELALADERMTPMLRSRVARALIDRVARGESYVIDTVIFLALTPAGPSHPGTAAFAAKQARLLTDALAGAADPPWRVSWLSALRTRRRTPRRSSRVTSYAPRSA